MDTKHYQLQLEKLKKRLLPKPGMRKAWKGRKAFAIPQELSPIDNHPADIASENYERAKDLSCTRETGCCRKK